MAPHGTALGKLAFFVGYALTLRGMLVVGISFIGEYAPPVRQELPGALTAADAAADTSAPWWWRCWCALATGP